jgi:hypothetical protein
MGNGLGVLITHYPLAGYILVFLVAVGCTPVTFCSVVHHIPIAGYWNFHNKLCSFLWGRNATDSTLVFFYYNLMANG